MKITMDESGLPYFEALASYTRLRIIRLLCVRDRNIKELAEALDVSSSIMTKHIRKLEDARVVTTANVRKDGSRHKLCSLVDMIAEIHLPKISSAGSLDSKCHCTALPIGLFSAAEALAPCGIAGENKLLAAIDKPSHLYCSERFAAQLLWIGAGYLQYTIPNDLTPDQRLVSIEISGEFGTPEDGERPTPVAVSLNGTALCTLAVTGVEQPGRWPFHRHGFLSVIRLDKEGVYVNGVKQSDAVLAALDPACACWILRLENAAPPGETGGFSLFGGRLGRNGQDLEIRFYYW